MLQMRNTRLFKSVFEALASGVSIQEEGVPMTYIKENGDTKVEIGVANAKFAGIAIARNMPPATLPMVEAGVIPESGTGTLTRAPIPGALLVKIDGVVATIVVTAPTAAGEVQVVKDQYAFFEDDAGKTATFQYQYVPTVQEARTVIGDIPYGGLAANALGTIACVKQGEVATSFFDASADWATALYAKIVDGKFVPATPSAGIPGVTVKNSPSVGNPFLVVELNIG